MESGPRVRMVCVSALSLALAVGPLTARPAHAQESDNQMLRYAATGALCLGIGVGYLVVRRYTNKKAEAEAAEKQAEAERVAAENTLAGKSVERIALALPPDQVATQSACLDLIATATLASGKQLVSAGAGGGLTQWSDYEVLVDGGEFRSGQVCTWNDPRDFSDHRVVITAKNVHDLDDVGTLELPLDYTVPMRGWFAGSDGYSGNSGHSGSRGNDGADNSDGDGGDAGHGGHGGNGQTGEAGAHGHNITVQADAVSDPVLGETMLRVVIRDDDTGGVYRFLIDGDEGELSIYASGGRGGSGGSGGSGGQGGYGGDANYDYGRAGNGGNAGDGGDGGDGGFGGDGGTITLILDPSAKAYRDTFQLYNGGGSGGSGGSTGFSGSTGSGGSGDVSGNYGQSGQNGQRGQDGRSGQAGPAPTVRVESVSLDW
jgi:hypothetical protein